MPETGIASIFSKKSIKTTWTIWALQLYQWLQLVSSSQTMGLELVQVISLAGRCVSIQSIVRLLLSKNRAGEQRQKSRKAYLPGISFGRNRSFRQTILLQMILELNH